MKKILYIVGLETESWYGFLAFPAEKQFPADFESHLRP